MDIKRIIRIYYKIAMVISVCCFFVPMFTVSCTYGNQSSEISALDILMGLKDVFGKPQYNPLVIFLLVIPAGILLLDFSNNIHIDRIPAAYLFGSAFEFVGWIILKEWLNYKLDKSLDEFQKAMVETKINTSFYFLLIVCVVSGVASFYDMHNKDMYYTPPSTSSIDELIYKIKEIFKRKPDNGYYDVGERLYVCKECAKAFAISNNRRTCPKDGGTLVDVNIPVYVWEKMSEDEKQRIKIRIIGRKKSSSGVYSPKMKSFMLFAVIVLLICLSFFAYAKYENLPIPIPLPTPDSEIDHSKESVPTEQNEIINHGDNSEMNNTVDEKSDYNKATTRELEDTKGLEEQKENIDLLSIARDYCDGKTMGDPIIEDFNGDGKEELVIETGREKYYDEGRKSCWVQSFVYTDGENTYQFDNWYEGDVLYDTKVFLIPVDKGYHFAVNTRWRNSILQGSISVASIYELKTNGADFLTGVGFCSLSNPQKNKIDIVFHEQDTPGEIEACRGSLFLRNGRYYAVGAFDGISNDYHNASIPPKLDPVDQWKGVDTKEIIGAYGIHFYVPSSWPGVYSDITGPEMIIYTNERCDKWIASTSCYHYEGSEAPFDWGEGQYVYSIGNVGDDHYFLCLPWNREDVEAAGYDWDFAENYLPDYNEYRERIANTAWVE